MKGLRVLIIRWFSTRHLLKISISHTSDNVIRHSKYKSSFLSELWSLDFVILNDASLMWLC